jgi:threonine/homoserine/homoserine lactone efflux protein
VPAEWIEFLLVVALLELTPGPNMAWLAALSIDKGRVVGMQAVAGIFTGLLVYLVASIAGIAALLATRPDVLEVLKWLGVAYLCYLAIEPWLNNASVKEQSGGRHFFQGLALNLLNPKAALFYITLLPRFVSETAGPVWLQSLWLGLIHISVATGVHVAIVFAGSGLQVWLDAGNRRRSLNIGFTVALLVTAAWLAIGGLKLA